MMIQRLSVGLAIALSVTACKKKDSDNPAAKPADNPGATKPEPAKPPEPPKPEPPKPMTGAEMAEMYKKCSSLINDKKWDDFTKTCVADDYTSHMGSMEMKGADKLKEMFASMSTAFPDMKTSPQLVLVNGKNIFAISQMTGTHEGTMKMPGMADVPATHKKFNTMFFHRLAINDQNKSSEEWGIEDHGTFAGQLGMLPKTAPPHRSVDDVKPFDGAPIVVVTADDAKEKANLEVAKKSQDAFNAHKTADVIATVADTVVETDYAHDKDVTGKKNVEKGLKDFQTAFSDGKMTVENTWAAGDYTVEMGTFDGTNDHDMGKMKKTGKHVSVPYAEVAQYKDGKVTHVWRFYDSAQFAIQLGLMPAPGAPTGDKPAGDKPAGDKPAGDKPADKAAPPAKK